MVMNEKRWWHVGVASTTVVLAVILLAGAPTAPHLAVGLSALVAFAGGWFAYGRLFRSSPRAAAAMVVTILVISPLAVWADPSLAVIQCIAYPLIWTSFERIAPSIVANVVLAAGIAVAFYIGGGATRDALLQAIVIEAISLVFSIAIGLWITSIATRSHERQVLLDELRAAQTQLAGLSRDAGVASERERLAREIHDTIAQDLTGIVLLAQRASRELAAGTSAAETLSLLEQSARTSLAETRALVAASAPLDLDNGGIAAALERLAQRFTRETAILVQVDAAVDEALERDLEVVVLRCVQEGLANIRKHSGAGRAWIRLQISPSERSLLISDDGSGFEPAAASDGYGLTGMRDRLALVGGTLSVESSEEGTTLLITLPRGAGA